MCSAPPALLRYKCRTYYGHISKDTVLRKAKTSSTMQSRSAPPTLLRYKCRTNDLPSDVLEDEEEDGYVVLGPLSIIIFQIYSFPKHSPIQC